MGTNMQDIQFLSTLSLRRATLLFWGEQYGGKISIHALLAESDGASNNPQHLPLAISIHALLAESDRHIFQVFAAAVIISIHALLAESDHVNPAQRAVMAAFLSTLSLRRATVVQRNVPLGLLISIHALLAESDDTSKDTIKTVVNFYPRSPCGERPRLMCFWRFGRLFLSTLSLRRATLNSSCISSIKKNFYPRSPCGERPLAHIRRFPFRYFYPRSPCGERRASILQTGLRRRISIHALLAESDSTSERLRIPSHYFYPRSPCGERPVLWG